MSKTRVPAIPAPTDANLRDVARAVKNVLDVREGLAGDPLDKSVTFRDLVDGGFADPLIISRGGGSGSISIAPSSNLTSGGTGGGSSNEPDLTPPPQATGLVASAGLAVVILSWDAPVYGNHAFTEIWRADTNVIGNAQRIGTTPAAMYNDALGSTGVTRYYWIRHRSTADVVGPYNSTNGTSATTGKVGNVDLGPLIVEAANLANGSVSATKLAAQAVELTKFANGIEPVTVVSGSTVPTVKSTNTIYLDGTGKLYRWNGTAYVASVPTTDLTGTVASSQIADNAIITAKIADAALTTAKFASTIEPLTIVTGTLPTTKSTNTIFRTDDSKTYRWNGSAYIASVATSDLSGTISDAQIAGLAASKVTGQLTNSQIADVAAAKVTGTLVASQIADATLTTAKFASTIEPITIVTGSLPTVKSTNTIYLTSDGKIYRWNGTVYTSASGISAFSELTGSIAGSQIPDATITTAKIADAALTTAKFASTIEPLTIVTGTLPTTKSTNTIYRTDDGKVYRWSGSAYVATVPTADLSGTIADAQIAGVAASKVTGQLTNSQIADVAAAKVTGTLVSSQIADAAITTAKFASSIEPLTIVTGTLPTTKSTNTIFRTDDSKTYRWNGTAYIATVATSDLSGTVSDAQIAGLAASKVTGQLTNSQIADLAAAKLTGTISTAQIADGSVSGTKFASGIEPVSVVSSVPGALSTRTVFNTTDGKLYRWSGSAYVATVPTADLSGTVSDAQIAGLAASKVTGQLTNSQIADVAAAKVTGQFVSSQIADAAITTAKFASGISPIEIVAALPSTGNFAGRVAFLTTDNKLYRHNGTAWIATVASSDISGTIADAQIAGLAASKVTGQLSDSQLAAISAAKISGQLTDTQLAAISAAKVTGTISSTQIADDAITTPKIFAGAITTAKIAASAVTAGEIAAGAITTVKLAASAVTANEIAAGAVIADKIASSAVTTAKLDAGAVTAAKIAAGTITATEIASATITGGKIAASTITGSNIAADTITAGQIAAGAIGASEVAASAITTDKLFVTGRGSALNDDPFTSDTQAWLSPGLWSAFWSIVNITDGPSGKTAIRATSGTSQSYAGSRQVAFNPNKAYRVRAKVRSNGSDGIFYLVVDLRDINGTVIGGDGTAWFYPVSGATVPTSWTDYEGKFGFGTDRPFPANAKTMSVGALMNYNATTGYHEVQDLRIEEMADASLIVDGAIVGSKIAANAVTTAKLDAGAVTAAKIAASTITANEIASGAITTAKIAAGAVTANEIAAATITGGKIAANTITGSNIAADTITAGQIAAGAVSASEIAAGAVRAQHLLVVPRSLNPDPMFEAGAAAWSGFVEQYTSGNAAVPSGCPGRIATKFQGRDNVGPFVLDVQPGEIYKISIWVNRQGTTSATGWVGYSFNAAGADLLTYPSGTTTASGWQQVVTEYTVPANVARVRLMPWIAYSGDGSQYAWFSDFQVEKKGDASLIVDGAIVASKISSGAVTTEKIAASAVTANEIASNAITTGKLDAGAVTTAKIAAGAVTATEIAASTITGGKIAAGTITGSNIAADTITAGQIAAGAIAASEIASGAITTSKLLVTGQGAALNDDPGCQDQSAWTGWSSQSAATVTAITDGRVGSSVLRATSSTRSVGSRLIPADPGKTYRLSAWVRQNGNGLLYLRTVDYAPNETLPAQGLERTYAGLEAVSPPANTWTRYSTQFTVPAGRAFFVPHILLAWGGTSGYMEAQDVRIEEVAPADLIVDGAISTSKLAANAVTAAKIAAGTITASEIASSTITGTNIAGGTITGSNIAAGTVQASNIAASTITGDKIAGNTITGSNIAADTITAGQIAAGAIGASEIAANAVTTSKLFVTGAGAALNADPSFVDPSAWIGGQVFLTGLTDGPSGSTALTNTVGSGSQPYSYDQIPIEPLKKYRLEVWVKQYAGSGGVMYAGVIWYDASGTALQSNTAQPSGAGNPAGWSNGSYSYMPTVSNHTPTSSWVRHSFGFGPGEIGAIPSNAKSVRLFIILNYNSNAGVQHAMAGFKLMEKADADLIVDGAITTDKLSANAVTAAKIAANTITASQIASSTITGTQIAGATITGSNIAGDTITAGQIAAGAIGASEVAAGAITTQKLLVAPASLCPDPYFSDTAWWTATSLDANGWYFESGASYTNTPVQVALWSGHPTNAPGANRKHVWSGNVASPANGTTLRLRARIRNDSNQLIKVQARFYDISSNPVFPDIVVSSSTYSGIQNLTAQGTVPNNAATIRFIIYNEADSTFSGSAGVSAVMLDVAASADLVVDGAITTDKLSANAVTAAKIAANTITASQIASSTITGTNIAGGTITGSNIAAGTVQASNIAASTITGDKIAGNTISGSNIAGDTITAGNIAAGAIGASEIAADAVIASKVLIKGRGAALNDDPSFSDESAWAYGGHGDTATRVAISDSVSGQYVYRSTPGSSSSIDSAKWFAVSSGKKYRLSVWVRRTSDANGGFYLRLLDQVSNQITSFAEYITPTTSWQKISYEFVPTTAQREVRLRTILNWTGTAGYHEIADFRLEEKTEGDLIVDGAITASKIQAGTITGDRIAGSTITGSNIAGSTITGSNIVGDTITAGNIAAGAIGASEVAAGAITASKILVSPYGMAINDDPMFADSSAWSLSGNTTFATGTSATNAVGNTYLICSVGTDQINYSAKTYPISPGKTYRLSASLYQSASGGRNMYLFVQFYDYNGDYVGSGVTGWGGTMSGYTFGGTLETNGVFMVKGAQFGAGTSLPIPASVRRVQIGVWFQYSGGPGSTNVIQAAQNLRLEEVVGADLIVDGSIIASKLSAGAIAVGSAAIANGAISNAMLGNAVVDNAKIADAAITNAKIADATIQSAKIAALDAGKITTGTLDAGRIAANSITAGKLSVASLSSITADVGTLTAGIIRNAADSFRLDATNGRTITQVGASMKVTGAPFGSANQFVEWFGPYFASLSSCTEANATYYLKVDGSAYFGGNLSAGTLYNTGATSDLNNNAQITVGPFGTNGNVKTVTLSYSFSGFWTQYQGSNTGTGSGTTSATVLLYRKIGAGAETQVGTLNVTGTWSYETDPEPQPGPTYIRSWTQGMSGSLTYTDNDASTLNRTYRAAMTARSIGFGILDGSYYQRVEIVSVEQ